jgi:hypothetical protein
MVSKGNCFVARKNYQVWFVVGLACFGFRSSGLLGCWSIGLIVRMLGCRSIGLWKCWFVGVLVCWDAGC